MSDLNKYGVEVDVEVFELIAKMYEVKAYSKSLISRITKFVLKTDQITGCLLIVAAPCPVVSKLAENDALLTYIVKFIKVHSVPKIHKMLLARYQDEFRRLELRMSAEGYQALLAQVGGEKI